MAVSIAALIPRVRDQLNDRPMFATQGSAADTTGVIAVTDGTDWDEGAVGEFQANGEQFKVISVSSNNLTCFRGWNGTTAAIQAASSTIFRDPRYSYRQVEQALTGRVHRLWPYAWKVGSASVTPSQTTRWNDLAATDMALINATQRYGASSEFEGWYGVEPGGYEAVDKPVLPIVFRRRMDAVVTSGTGVRFPGGFHHATNTITVRTARRITGTSDIEDSEILPVGETLVLGALATLLRGGQIERVGAGVNRDQAATIGSTSRLQTFGVLESDFRDQLQLLKFMHEQVYPLAPIWE